MAEQRTVDVDLSVYPLDVVKKAAYRLTDRFALAVQLDGNKAVCTLSFEPGAETDSVELGLRLFQKELLDQDLRSTVRDETAGIRNLILAHAFSKTGLISDDPISGP